MRRKDREITDRAAIEEILDKAVDCSLAMVDDGMPYVVFMNFGYKDNCLYLHSAREGRKMDILAKNSSVCFTAQIQSRIVRSESACSWTMKYMSVIGFGKASLVNDSSQKRKALDIIMNKYCSIMDSSFTDTSFEYSDSSIDGVMVIKIEIENITGKKSGY